MSNCDADHWPSQLRCKFLSARHSANSTYGGVGVVLERDALRAVVVRAIAAVKDASESSEDVTSLLQTYLDILPSFSGDFYTPTNAPRVVRSDILYRITISCPFEKAKAASEDKLLDPRLYLRRCSALQNLIHSSLLSSNTTCLEDVFDVQEIDVETGVVFKTLCRSLEMNLLPNLERLNITCVVAETCNDYLLMFCSALHRMPPNKINSISFCHTPIDTLLRVKLLECVSSRLVGLKSLTFIGTDCPTEDDGFVIPDQQLLRNSSLNELRFKEVSFTDGILRTLLSSGFTRNLKILDIERTRCDATAQILSLAITSGNLTFIESLSMRRNNIGDKELIFFSTAISEFVGGRKSLQRMRKLDVRQNSFGDEGLASLTSAIHDPSTLPVLSILFVGNNESLTFSDEEMASLLQELSFRPDVEILNAQNASVGPMSMDAIYLGNSNSLKNLTLNSNPIRDIGIIALCNRLERRHVGSAINGGCDLSFLGLNSCMIGDKGMASLAKCCVVLPNLSTMLLAHNFIGDAGWVVFLDTLRKDNGELALASLVRLDLEGNNISNIKMNMFCDSISEGALPKLEQISFNETNLTEKILRVCAEKHIRIH